MPQICDICGKTGIPDEAIVHFDNRKICQDCKDGFFQKLREGATPPRALGMLRRIAVLSLHLVWTAFSAYVILALIGWGLTFATRNFPSSGGPEATPGDRIVAWVWSLVMFVLAPAVSACAAILTVRFASRQLGIAPKEALKSLAPPLLIILVATGVPAALLCGILVFAMFIGFLLALFLTPYFLTILFALAYLLWLKWRARSSWAKDR